jgi:hypothetical protein
MEVALTGVRAITVSWMRCVGGLWDGDEAEGGGGLGVGGWG